MGFALDDHAHSQPTPTPEKEERAPATPTPPPFLYSSYLSNLQNENKQMEDQIAPLTQNDL